MKVYIVVRRKQPEGCINLAVYSTERLAERHCRMAAKANDLIDVTYYVEALEVRNTYPI